ncbi:MAG: glutamylcysteine synthetase [Ruminococcus bromii]|nr:glutamylcysteine synthetase [Ruminococcus bromii]MDD6434407.1 glutamylcysteine synthetase [Ruminococcus bromii]MDY4712150.1 glutamylcysteine synthetase [Ruminococcus bromii]
MNTEEFKQLLFDRFIKPTINNQNNYIGVEIEMPILNLDKKPVNFEIVHNITEKFIEHFDFLPVGIDEDGNIYSAKSSQNSDILSYDCSYNNLELSFGKEENLFEIQKRFDVYYRYLQEIFRLYNYTLTGMGVNPYRVYNKNEPIPNGRYRMLYHHLSSYPMYGNLPMYFHSYPKFGMFSSASQVQLDANYNDLPRLINVFSELEPIKAVLFSNSVLTGDHEEYICCRDIFWENSTHGINPHNIGMYNQKFENVEEIVNYISTTSIYCVERDGKYINFSPILFSDYLKLEGIVGEYYENGRYRKILVQPSVYDIEYLRTFKFEDITYRGTIEFRSVCCQPISDSMVVAAFHLGIKNNLDKAEQILQNDTVLLGNGYITTELRKLLIKTEMPSFIDIDGLYRLARDVVDAASDGLKSRGKGEEILLAPLYERIDKRTNPARTMLNLMNKGTPVEKIIEMYS